MAYIVENNTPTYPANVSFSKIDLDANITVSWPFFITSSVIIAGCNYIYPTANDFIITLPDATLADPGTDIIFVNKSADFSFDVYNNQGAKIYTFAPGEVEANTAADLKLSDNSTAAGQWDVFPFIGGYSGVTAFEITSDTLVITNGEVPTDGTTVNIEINDSLSSIEEIKTTGLAVVSDLDPWTWGTVSLVGTSNIDITNPSGTDGNGKVYNITIDLNPILTNLTSVQVGNITLSNSTLTTVSSNSDLNLTTNGTGVLNLNGFKINSSGVVTGGSIKASCVFTCSSVVAIQSSFNISSVAPVSGQSGNFEGFFTTSMPNVNYGVIATTGTDGGSLPFRSQALLVTRNLSSFVICVVDASGEPLSDIDFPLSVIIV
jgi:FlaG/FlaF family flagellin (archaellin)